MKRLQRVLAAAMAAWLLAACSEFQANPLDSFSSLGSVDPVEGPPVLTSYKGNFQKIVYFEGADRYAPRPEDTLLELIVNDESKVEGHLTSPQCQQSVIMDASYYYDLIDGFHRARPVEEPIGFIDNPNAPTVSITIYENLRLSRVLEKTLHFDFRFPAFDNVTGEEVIGMVDRLKRQICNHPGLN